MIMDSGACTAHDNAITRNVTHRACSRPGSVSTVRQLAKPAGWIAPMPSHDVKLSASTPMRGMTPNPRKTASAGSDIQATAPVRPPRAPVTGAPTTGGASVVIGR